MQFIRKINDAERKQMLANILGITVSITDIYVREMLTSDSRRVYLVTTKRNFPASQGSFEQEFDREYSDGFIQPQSILLHYAYVDFDGLIIRGPAPNIPRGKTITIF